VVAFVTEATMFGFGKNRVWYLLQKRNVKNSKKMALTTPPSLWKLMRAWSKHVFFHDRNDVNPTVLQKWLVYGQQRRAKRSGARREHTLCYIL